MALKNNILIYVLLSHIIMYHYAVKFTNFKPSSQGVQTMHTYCIFSSDKEIFLTEFPYKKDVLSIWKIENKIMDEGIFKISRNKFTWSPIEKWLKNIGAQNVSYINTISLEIGSVKQFEDIKGTFEVVKTNQNPRYNNKSNDWDQ